tara:strand:+ start:352 stop:621 length:270 start_codon:yes stop_codon:yes gene_type:complete
MAKTKTKKVEKPTKISNEQLDNVQKVINNLNRSQIEIGSIETQKHTLMHHVMTIQEELRKIQKELQEEYGTDDINIKTGEINYGDVKTD